MKFGKVAALCRKAGSVVLWGRQAGITQWIGTGGAMYLADGLPFMDADSVLSMLDVPLAKREDFVSNVKPIPMGLSLKSVEDSELLLEAEPCQVVIPEKGLTLQPLTAQDGSVLWINAKYLEPLGYGDYTKLVCRQMPGGKPYCVVKDGMFAKAVISPEDVEEQTVGNLSRLAMQTMVQHNVDNHPSD